MKKLCLLITYCCIFQLLPAQELGLRVGLNATSANIDVLNQSLETEGETNLALGLFLNLPLGAKILSIQPELTYLKRGYSSEDVLSGVIDTEVSVAYFDVGALLRLNIINEGPVGLYAGAGPYFSYALSGSVIEAGSDERDIDFDADRLNRGELQVAGIAGVSFGAGLRLFGEVRYQGSLGDQSDLQDVDINQSSIGFHAGILLPLGD